MLLLRPTLGRRILARRFRPRKDGRPFIAVRILPVLLLPLVSRLRPTLGIPPWRIIHRLDRLHWVPRNLTLLDGLDAFLELAVVDVGAFPLGRLWGDQSGARVRGMVYARSCPRGIVQTSSWVAVDGCATVWARGE